LPDPRIAATIPANRGWELAVDIEPITLRAVEFAEIAGWATDAHEVAFAALLKSCKKRGAADPICAAALALGDRPSRETARTFFEAHYEPRAVESYRSSGFVTGYYEPEVRGSRTQQGKFQFPIYRRPDDLVPMVPDQFRARFNDQLSAMRRVGNEFVPYYTRAEIENGALEDQDLEMLYLDDPVDLFFMQVQGSGFVRLPDGSTTRLSYAGKNGYPYTSIGKLLVERGELTREAASADGVKAWLRADRDRGKKLMQENRSYIFFRELWAHEREDGPVGADGVPLTPGRSLAVDASYHAFATPIFVSAPKLDDGEGQPFQRLMIAQDVGSAIRGPERGDIFWGSGADAGALAGETRHDAKFFILVPRE
jgi:membrane-bound lytic murein transglycosylase A